MQPGKASLAKAEKLMETNIRANITIVNLRSQLAISGSSTSAVEKIKLSEKLSDSELYDGDKQRLRSWIFSFLVERYPTASTQKKYVISPLTRKALHQVEPQVKTDSTIYLVSLNDMILHYQTAVLFWVT